MENAVSATREDSNYLQSVRDGLGTIGADEVALKIEFRQENKALQTLGLSDNEIGPEGVKAIADALKVNISIIMLVLDGDTKAIADALKRNTAIRAAFSGSLELLSSIKRSILSDMYAGCSPETLFVSVQPLELDSLESSVDARVVTFTGPWSASELGRALSCISMSYPNVLALNLNKSGIAELPSDAIWPSKLVAVDLRGNPLQTLPPSIVEAWQSLTHLWLTGCPVFDSLSFEVKEACSSLSQLIQSMSQECFPAYRAKVMLLGDTEAGKTSLWHQLHGWNTGCVDVFTKWPAAIRKDDSRFRAWSKGALNRVRGLSVAPQSFKPAVCIVSAECLWVWKWKHWSNHRQRPADAEFVVPLKDFRATWQPLVSLTKRHAMSKHSLSDKKKRASGAETDAVATLLRLTLMSDDKQGQRGLSGPLMTHEVCVDFGPVFQADGEAGLKAWRDMFAWMCRQDGTGGTLPASSPAGSPEEHLQASLSPRHDDRHRRTVGIVVDSRSLPPVVNPITDESEQLSTVDRTKQLLQLTCWDFAGENFYFFGHRVFLRPDALYVLVWNMCDPNGVDQIKDYLKSIAVYAARDDGARDSESKRRALLIVGTRFDVLMRDDLAERSAAAARDDFARNEWRNAQPAVQEQQRKISDAVKMGPAALRDMQLVQIAVSLKDPVAGVTDVRDAILTVAAGLPQVGKMVPHSILKLQDVLEQMRDERFIGVDALYAKLPVLLKAYQANEHASFVVDADQRVPFEEFMLVLRVLDQWSKCILYERRGVLQRVAHKPMVTAASFDGHADSNENEDGIAASSGTADDLGTGMIILDPNWFTQCVIGPLFNQRATQDRTTVTVASVSEAIQLCEILVSYDLVIFISQAMMDDMDFKKMPACRLAFVPVLDVFSVASDSGGEDEMPPDKRFLLIPSRLPVAFDARQCDGYWSSDVSAECIRVFTFGKVEADAGKQDRWLWHGLAPELLCRLHRCLGQIPALTVERWVYPSRGAMFVNIAQNVTSAEIRVTEHTVSVRVQGNLEGVVSDGRYVPECLLLSALTDEVYATLVDRKISFNEEVVCVPCWRAAVLAPDDPNVDIKRWRIDRSSTNGRVLDYGSMASRVPALNCDVRRGKHDYPDWFYLGLSPSALIPDCAMREEVRGACAKFLALETQRKLDNILLELKRLYDFLMQLDQVKCPRMVVLEEAGGGVHKNYLLHAYCEYWDGPHRTTHPGVKIAVERKALAHIAKAALFVSKTLSRAVMLSSLALGVGPIVAGIGAAAVGYIRRGQAVAEALIEQADKTTTFVERLREVESPLLDADNAIVKGDLAREVERDCMDAVHALLAADSEFGRDSLVYADLHKTQRNGRVFWLCSDHRAQLESEHGAKAVTR